MVFRPTTAAVTLSSASAMLHTTALTAVWIFPSIWVKVDSILADRAKAPLSPALRILLVLHGLQGGRRDHRRRRQSNSDAGSTPSQRLLVGYLSASCLAPNGVGWFYMAIGVREDTTSL